MDWHSFITHLRRRVCAVTPTVKRPTKGAYQTLKFFKRPFIEHYGIMFKFVFVASVKKTIYIYIIFTIIYQYSAGYQSAKVLFSLVAQSQNNIKSYFC